MSLLWLAQAVNLRAIQERFNRPAWDPETWIGIIVVVGAIGAFLLLLHAILYYEKRVEDPKVVRDPQKLFREMLAKLPLNHMQRQLLRNVSRDLQAPHPTSMLLSPTLYIEATRRWLGKTEGTKAEESKELSAIAGALFPDETHV